VSPDPHSEAQYALTRVLAEARTLAQAAEGGIRAIAEHLNWDAGLYWGVDEAAGALRCLAIWQAEPERFDELEAVSRTLTFERGAGLPGRAWAAGEPAWVEDVLADRRLPRRHAAARGGLKTGIAFPVQGARITGVIELFSRQAREPDDDLLRMLESYGRQFGQLVDRLDAQARLAQGEARNSAIVESALDAIITMDDRGRIVEFNTAAERTFGHDRADVLGRELADVIIPPQFRDAHRRSLARYLETGETTILGDRIGVTALHADGREFPVELTIIRVGVPGAPLFTGFVRDVSEWVAAEQALREQRALLEALTDNTSDAVFVKDREGRYLMINQAGAAALGRTIDEVLGRDDRAVMEPADAEAVMATDREVMESGETRSGEETIDTPAGRLTYLSTKSAWRDEEGRVLGLVGIAHDITEHRRLELELREGQKMDAIGRLAGGVAHDFNNLLSVIRGFTDLALRRIDSGNAEVQDWLSQVNVAADQGAALTRQLLAFSRRQPLETSVLELNAVIADMDALLRRVLGEDLRVVTVFGASPGRVELNRGQLEQVLLNLVVNARDAMPAGGKLTIETRDTVLDRMAADSLAVEPGAHIVLRVADTGVGMDADTLAHVFEPFFTTKSGGRGTGLGLATVYGIVTGAGGHVGVTSRPGAGATFTVHLPAATAPVGKAAAAPASSDGAAAHARVLVAEDDERLRTMMRTVLEEGGYEVRAAGSGDEALALAERTGCEFEVLVTDIVMPGMQGPELASHVRALRPEIRVVFVSGYSEHPVENELREGDAFLAKPFRPDDLLARLAALLRAA
jgi:PAS domain S-box-containing protein